MTKTFTDITHTNFRCSVGACPGIHRSKDGKTFVVVGKYAQQHADAGPGEGAVEISADLVLASLGVNDLVEAAKPIVNALEKNEQWLVSVLSKLGSDETQFKITQGQARTLREAVNRIKGGAS